MLSAFFFLLWVYFSIIRESDFSKQKTHPFPPLLPKPPTFIMRLIKNPEFKCHCVRAIPSDFDIASRGKSWSATKYIQVVLLSRTEYSRNCNSPNHKSRFIQLFHCAWGRPRLKREVARVRNNIQTAQVNFSVVWQEVGTRKLRFVPANQLGSAIQHSVVPLFHLHHILRVSIFKWKTTLVWEKKVTLGADAASVYHGLKEPNERV